MITFMGMLLVEGGKATKKWGTERANKDDIIKCLEFVADHTGIDVGVLRSNVLGSVDLTMMGYRDDSGDVDIALPQDKYSKEDIHKKMMKAVNGEGVLGGLGVGSYAVTAGKKKIQVDLMYVPNVKWAKFVYKNDEGRKSKFKNLIRNELLTCVLHQKIVPGEDVLIKDDEGNVIARASRSFKWDTGVERLFKSTTNRKDGKGRTKNMGNVTPAQLKKELEQMGVNDSFKDTPDTITNPDDFAVLLFGENTKTKSIETVESLLHSMKNKLSKTEYNAAMKEAATVLYKRQAKEKFEMPLEFEEFK